MRPDDGLERDGIHVVVICTSLLLSSPSCRSFPPRDPPKPTEPVHRIFHCAAMPKEGKSAADPTQPDNDRGPTWNLDATQPNTRVPNSFQLKSTCSDIQTTAATTKLWTQTEGQARFPQVDFAPFPPATHSPATCCAPNRLCVIYKRLASHPQSSRLAVEGVIFSNVDRGPSAAVMFSYETPYRSNSLVPLNKRAVCITMVG